MQLSRIRRHFAVGFAIAIASMLGLFAYTSSASTALTMVYSNRPTTTCDRTGAAAPAVFQGGRFQLKMEQYWDELVEVDIAFPDGRLFTVPASLLLDGTLDQVTNIPSLSRGNANIAGRTAATSSRGAA
jgi:hypothetical protein